MSVKSLLSGWRYRLSWMSARHAFNVASPEGTRYLPESSWEQFEKSHGMSGAGPMQDYSLDGLRERGQKRADFLERFGSLAGKSVLEIGAADGFVLKSCIEKNAERAVSVDLEDALHEEPRKAGVEAMRMNAEHLSGLPDASFDRIFSFGSLEHIEDPASAVREVCRVLRPGGQAYFEAGPLYFSPWGFHFYSVAKIPYVHLLYDPMFLRKIARQRNVHLPDVNGKPSKVYLSLKNVLPEDVVLEKQLTGYDWFHADMVRKHAALFKGQSQQFDDFFVDTIKIFLRKRDA